MTTLGVNLSQLSTGDWEVVSLVVDMLKNMAAEVSVVLLIKI